MHPATTTPLKIAVALVLFVGAALPVRADEDAETLLKKAEIATQAVQSLTADYTETYATSRRPSSGWSNTVKKSNFYSEDRVERPILLYQEGIAKSQQDQLRFCSKHQIYHSMRGCQFAIQD